MDRLLFRARALILSDLDLNISFWARKVTRAFEKRAHGPVSRANVDKFHVRGLYKPIFTSHEFGHQLRPPTNRNHDHHESNFRI